MTYEITDSYHTLKLTLESNGMGKPSLDVYINDNTTPFKRYSPSTSTSPYVYTVKHSDFNIGDIITQFKLVQDTDILPWQTHEGVVVLVDGIELVNLNKTNSTTIDGNHTQFTSQFDEGVHDIQAFYVGNDEYDLSYTPRRNFIVKQPEVQESGGTPPVTGAYRLAFYGDVPKSTVYGKTVKVYLQLTKGGVPVNGEVVERVFGGESIDTSTTHTIKNVVGLVEFDTANVGVGKYKIGGYFTKDTKKVHSTYRDFTINKAPTTITIDGGSYKKGSTIKFYFKYNTTTPIKNEKVQLYINGKLKSFTTDKNGKIAYQFGSKGTFKFKAIYKGTSNIDKQEFTTTITITE